MMRRWCFLGLRTHRSEGGVKAMFEACFGIVVHFTALFLFVRVHLIPLCRGELACIYGVFACNRDDRT